MKRMVLGALLFWGFVYSAGAQVSADPPFKQVDLGIMGGGLYTSNIWDVSLYGGGGGLRGFYFFDRTFGAGFQTGAYVIDGSQPLNPTGNKAIGTMNSTFTVFNFMPSVKLYLNSADIAPYLVGGGGLSLLAQNVTSVVTPGLVNPNPSGNPPVESGPAMEGGVGLEIRSDASLKFFIEAKATHLFLPDYGITYFFLQTGADFGL